MAAHDLQAEQAALRAMLHLPGAEPVWIDIKPGPLTLPSGSGLKLGLRP
jgi:hypothetical protein